MSSEMKDARASETAETTLNDTSEDFHDAQDEPDVHPATAAPSNVQLEEAAPARNQLDGVEDSTENLSASNDEQGAVTNVPEPHSEQFSINGSETMDIPAPPESSPSTLR